MLSLKGTGNSALQTLLGWVKATLLFVEKNAVALEVGVPVITWMWLQAVELLWWAELALNDFCYLWLTYVLVTKLGKRRGLLTKRFLHANGFAEKLLAGLAVVTIVALALEPTIYVTHVFAASTSVSTSGDQHSTAYGPQRKILRTTDANQTIHVIFENSTGEIDWFRSTDNGQSFAEAFLSTLTALNPSLAKDSANNIHMAYESNGQIYYCKQAYNATAWGSAIRLDDTSNAFYPSIAIDGNGYIHVVWCNNIQHPNANKRANKVYYARSTNGGSSFSTPVDITLDEYTAANTAGTFPSIVINGTNNNLYVTWWRGDTYLYLRRCVYSAGPTWTWDGTSQTISTAMSTASTTINTNMVHSAVYANSKYRVAYCESGTAKYRDWNESSWSTAISLAAVSNYPSLTYDNQDYLYVFYETNATNSNYDIRYQKSTDTTPSGFDSAVNISNDNTGNHYVGTNMDSVVPRVELIWTNGTSSPYTIKYDCFILDSWTYSTGATSLSAPSVDPSGGYAAIGTNSGVDSIATTDGTQRSGFPYTISATVQSRASIVNVGGTKTIYAAASNGYLYAVNAATGGLIWNADVAGVGNELRGGVAIQNNVVSGEDYVFVGTYNPASATTNKLYALYTTTDNGKTVGAVAWSAPSDSMDVVESTPAVDWSNDRVYITSKSNSGAQKSLWAINTADGSVAWSQSLGDITSSAVVVGGNVYVGSDSGTLYKYDLGGNEKWTFPLGSQVQGFPWVQAGKIYVSTASNGIYKLTDGASSASQDWNVSNATIASPSYPLVVLGLGALYVGSSDGKLYEVAVSNGSVNSWSYNGGSTVGNPTFDTSKGYIYVGTNSDKKIRAVSPYAF